MSPAPRIVSTTVAHLIVARDTDRVAGEIVAMSDGRHWFHPYSGKPPVLLPERFAA